MPRRLLALAALIGAPLLVVDVPPLLDYPNHLARLYLLAHGAADPALAAMFATQWAIIPNLAVDLIGPPLVRLLPVHDAGRLLLALGLLLPVAGVIAYSRALFGRAHRWPLGSALIAVNAPFLLGFMNFLIGIGVALLLAAFWIARRDRHPATTITVATLGMAGVFFCHLMGALFAAILITAWEAGHPGRGPGRAWALLPLLAAPSSLYLASPLGSEPAGIVYLPLGDKFAQLLWPFTSYAFPLDLLTAAIVIGIPLACALTGRLVVPRATRIGLAVLAALYAAAPYAFKGTQSLDTRITLMMALLLFAGLHATGIAPRSARLAVAALVLLGLARTAVTATAWQGHATDIADLRQAIAPIPPGARVLVAAVSPAEAAEYWSAAPAARRLSNGIRTDTHLPALVLIERHAFWPLLFNDPAQQPIAWTRTLQTLADQAGGLIDHHALKKSQLCGYGFLLVLWPDGDPDLARYRPADLTLHTRTPAGALFTIQPASSDCG